MTILVGEDGCELGYLQIVQGGKTYLEYAAASADKGRQQAAFLVDPDARLIRDQDAINGPGANRVSDITAEAPQLGMLLPGERPPIRLGAWRKRETVEAE
jgi:hypothetical protein